jgi:hypothetical protein
MKKLKRARMAEPFVIIPSIRINQPDGSVLFRPGKPISSDEMVDTSGAARLMGMSRRWILNECELGAFTTARRAGLQPKSRWKIALWELQKRLEDSK